MNGEMEMRETEGCGETGNMSEMEGCVFLFCFVLPEEAIPYSFLHLLMEEKLKNPFYRTVMRI